MNEKVAIHTWVKCRSAVYFEHCTKTTKLIINRTRGIRKRSSLSDLWPSCWGESSSSLNVLSRPGQVIHVTGRLRIRMALTHSRSVPNQIMGMVVVAHALPPPTINEVRIDCQMFVTRVNMDLKIVYCENRYGGGEWAAWCPSVKLFSYFIKQCEICTEGQRGHKSLWIFFFFFYCILSLQVK